MRTLAILGFSALGFILWRSSSSDARVAPTGDLVSAHVVSVYQDAGVNMVELASPESTSERVNPLRLPFKVAAGGEAGGGVTNTLVPKVVLEAAVKDPKSWKVVFNSAGFEMASITDADRAEMTKLRQLFELEAWRTSMMNQIEQAKISEAAMSRSLETVQKMIDQVRDERLDGVKHSVKKARGGFEDARRLRRECFTVGGIGLPDVSEGQVREITTELDAISAEWGPSTGLDARRQVLLFIGKMQAVSAAEMIGWTAGLNFEYARRKEAIMRG
jgi:hypothetical protein